jgi:hypothetical protein
LLKRQWLEALLVAALAVLSLQLYLANRPANPAPPEVMLRAEDGDADISLRNEDFPSTFISEIHADLTSPHHWVRLVWSGPQASAQETGPFQGAPGRGTGDNDCNDPDESCSSRSNCTPKGTWEVQAFSDYMTSAKPFKFVTWFNTNREIGFHSHPQVPDHPASMGCVRLDEHAAQLIHNNSVVGRTKVFVDGTWTPPPES